MKTFRTKCADKFLKHFHLVCSDKDSNTWLPVQQHVVDQLAGNSKLIDDNDTSTRYMHLLQQNMKQRHLVWLHHHPKKCIWVF
jgi:hypothetical protein